MSQRKTIIVVDDEPIVLKSIELLLEDDAEVITFSERGSGKRVIEWIDEGNHFDIAILDLLINGISGTDIAQHIIDRYGTSKRIIFLTGCSANAPEYIKAKKMAETIDNVYFFTKDVSPEEHDFTEEIEDLVLT